MSSSNVLTPQEVLRRALVAKARPALEDLVDVALAGDLARVLAMVEEAGGPEVYGEDAGLVESLCLGKGHAVEADEVRALAREIAADARPVVEAPDARRAEARGLLARLASSLGLAVEPRAAAAPVVLRSGGMASGDHGFVGSAISGAIGGVRAIMRDIFAGQAGMPRVDQMVTLVAPALTPGVYALQRRALGGRGDVAGLPGVDEVRARLGAGRPLEAGVRREVAERLAAAGRSIDLERLTIHDGAEADALCRELEAEAFALGDALVFRAGAFRPESLDGMHLLVHELTHVWQQAHGLAAPGVDADPGLELEAERVADRVAAPVFDVAATAGVPVNDGPAAGVEIDGVQSIATEVGADVGAIQRCGPREMAAKDNPPRRDPKRDPDDPVDPDPIIEPVPDPVPPDPVPPVPDDPGAECEACPEPDLEHTTFEPMRKLTDKPAAPGQKKIELSLAGHSIKVEIPEAQAAGEIEVTFPPDASPFTALILKKAKLRFDDTLRVLDGEISAGIDLGNFVHVANTTLRVFEDGRIGAEIRGVEVNVADNVHALVDLVIGPEGVWGMCTVTADKVFVSDMVDVKNGLLHLRVDKKGAVSMHGECTVQVHGIGEADLEVCYVDGKWGGSIAIGRREDLEIVPGVVLEEIMVTGCFAPDEWWVRGNIKVRILDKFRVTADAKYHWKEGEGKWSFEADLDQFEDMPLVGDLALSDVAAHVKYDEGKWDPATFQARIKHPWVEGGIEDGTWDIEENLWSGEGYVKLAKQLPMGDSGITLDEAEVRAFVSKNEFTEIRGKAAAMFPFQGEPTFKLSCLDAVYKVKEEALWATANLRSIRDIQFGGDSGFHAIIRKDAGVTAIVAESELTETLGGMAFEARYADKLLGDGGLFFKWKPGGGVDAGGRFDLKQRFGLPEYAEGPLFLLPQPGHFEFQVIDSKPQFIEAQGVGFEIAQAEGGLIDGQVSGRFDFTTNTGDLKGRARVAKSWTEQLGDFGSITFLESKSQNLEVEIAKNTLTKAQGHLEVRIDANASEHVDAFTLVGHVNGAYDPKTGKVSGELGAELKTDLVIKLEGDDEVIIKEGSWFTANVTDSTPDKFQMQLVAQYVRNGELFLEGACEEATFDFKTGELDFLGKLTLKQTIEKSLGETEYSLALVKDVTQMEVEVRKNKLIRVGGDVEVELHDGEGTLLVGSLRNADYRVQEELFSGELELSLWRDLAWPKGDAGGVPKGLSVTLVKGSQVSGHIEANVFTEAAVGLLGRVQYKGREQAEAKLDGRWNLTADLYDLNGYFKLTNDLVLGADPAADATDMTDWSLAFVKDSIVTIGVAANTFQPVGVDVRMELRRGGIAAADGSVRGDYVFGADGGFNGDVSFDVCREIKLGRAGRFDIVLTDETHAEGVVAGNAFTQGLVDVVLVAREGKTDKARLSVSVDYTGGGEFSGNAAIEVLDGIRMAERTMGGAKYAVDLNTKTRANIVLDKNMLKTFDGQVGIDVLKDEAAFAEGDFKLTYDFSDPSASVNATGELRLIGTLELGKVGAYSFALEGGSGIKGCVENGGLAWISGKLLLAASTAKDGRFATLEIDGKYEGGTQPKFDGSAVATVLAEHDLGFTAYNYGFFLQPASGFSIVMKESVFSEMHGDIGVLARQRSKKDKGMRGDVRMTLSGDAVKVGSEWKFDGHADASVEGGIKVGAAGGYEFWIETGSNIAVDVRANRFVSVEGTLKGKVTENGKGFLGFDCWVRYAAGEGEGDKGVVDARGSCRLLGEKELYRNGGFVFSLLPTAGYTALIVVEKNEVKEVGGTLAFRLENSNAKPQPLKVSGSATGHYDNTTGIFSGRGDIRLDSDLEYAMGKNKIVLEKGSGGMTEIAENRLKRLGGKLIGRFDDADGPLVKVEASGDFDAEIPELVELKGSATLMRELRMGPEGAPWIIVDKGLSCQVRMAHNKLTYAKGSNGKFTVPALRLKGGFDHITMDATGDKTKYSGKGFLEMEMLKEDKDKGRKLKGRLDVEYREDDTWDAKGTVDYAITPYLGGQITAEMDQTLDPVLGGTLVMTKKEMMPARDLFEMQFPLIPDTFIPVAGIAGIGFGARAYFGLSSLPMTLSASVGVSNFRPRQMNVPDFEAEAEIDWGLRMKAGALAYLDARLDVLVASASIGIQGTAEIAGDALVKAKGKLAGKSGKYSGELGVGLAFAPKVTLKAQPYAKASLFDNEWTKTWDAYEYDLGEVFKYEWGSTYKFGDVPEAPKANSERNDAAMSGGARQDLSTVNSKAEADSFGDERASPGVAATQGRPGMESGAELKDKKEEKKADGMDDLEEQGKEAGDLGSVMAAVGNIISQLGQILLSLAYGPIGLILCVCWKWISGDLDKLYADYCTVRDYIKKNWDKIKPYLPTWFTSFVEFMANPTSAVDKWWNADVYTRQAVAAGDHLKAPAEVRGNMVGNLFGGIAADGDRRSIEELFEFSKNKGDLRQVIIASEYHVNSFPESWYRHDDWAGSRLQRIYVGSGWNVDPGYVRTNSNVDFDKDETSGGDAGGAGEVQAHAAQGIREGGGALPFAGEIQASFGAHDVGGIAAHTGDAAKEANAALGANAYASGEHVAFGGAPDLHTAAHEAAHVVQQRQGVSLSDGVGQSGDAYEQHADAVADAVVAGESAEGMLGAQGGDAGAGAVQKKESDKQDGEKKEEKGAGEGGDEVGLHEALKARSDELFAPALGKLEARITRVSSFGVDVLDASAGLDAMKSSAMYRELEAVLTTAPTGEGAKEQIELAGESLDVVIDELGVLGAAVDDAIVAFKSKLAERVGALEAKVAAFEEARGGAPWFGALFLDQLKALAVARAAVTKAHQGLVAGLDGEQPVGELSAALDEAEASLEASRERAEQHLAEGGKAIEALRSAVRGAVDGAEQSQRGALGTTEKLSFTALFTTTRFGHPKHSVQAERVQSYVADVALHASVEAHRVVFLAHGGIPAEISAGMGLDGKEAAHWKTHKIGAAATEYGYAEAKAKFEAATWLAKVAEAELPVFESAWKALGEVLASATQAIRLGAQNGGADLAAAIEGAEKAFADAREVVSKLHVDGLATKAALDERLGKRAEEVLAAKKSISDDEPRISSLFLTLYKTARFGDERLGDTERVNGLIKLLGAKEPYALVELARVLRLYDAVPDLHRHLASSKKVDGDELEVWKDRCEKTLGDHEAILQRALDIGWLNNQQSVAKQLSAAVSELQALFNDAHEPIIAGSVYNSTWSELAERIGSSREAFGKAKAEAEALVSPSLDKAGVIARIKTYLEADKIGSEGAATVEADLKASLDKTLTEGVLERIAKALPVIAHDPADKPALLASIRSSIYDLIVSTPALYETIVNNRLVAGEAAKETSSETAKGALEVDKALSPATQLAKSIADKKSGPDKLLVIRGFVEKWGEAEVGGVLKEARVHVDVVKALASLTTTELALAQRMLLSGKVAAAHSVGDADMPLEQRLELAALQESKDPKTQFVGLTISLLSFAQALEDEKVAFAKRQADAKADADPDAAAKVTFDEALEKKRVAYVAKTATSVTIVNLIKALGEIDSHIAIVGFKTADAAPVETTSDPEALKLGGANADRVDVNDDQGGKLKDDAKAKELAELHDKLGPELAMFGVKKTGYGHGNYWWSIDSAAIGKLVGSPPDVTKVRYCLDRLEEKLKKPYFESDLFKSKLSDQQRSAARNALGYDPSASYGEDRKIYAEALDRLVMSLDSVANAGADVGAIAFHLQDARKLADKVFEQLKAIDDTKLVDPIIAPNTRRPQTAVMVLLNAFRHVKGLDFVTHLENQFHQVGWISWALSYFDTRTEPGEPADRQRLRDELTLLGFEVKVVDKPSDDSATGATEAEAIKGDITTKDAKGLVGADKKFVVDGMDVSSGFDDAAALAIAENVYSALNSAAEVIAGLTKKDAKPTDKPLSIAVLSGAFTELLNLLSRGDAMVRHLLLNIKNLRPDERDATDSAFRARYGRTLSAEFARHDKGDTMAPTMSVDRDDEEAKRKNVLRGIATIEKSMDSLIAAIAKLEPDQRKAVAEDKVLMEVLRAVAPARNDELDKILAGAMSFEELSAIIKKNDKAVDDIEGVKKDITNYLNVLAGEIRKKYPDALKADGKDHVAHKAAFEADYRVELVRLMTQDWSKVAKNQNPIEWCVGNVFLNDTELGLLKAIILNGGSASGSAQMIAEMRTSKFWGGKSADDIKASLKGLADADRAMVKDDLEVRAAIQKGLSAEDAASCFALLDGKVGVTTDKSLKVLFISWKSLDAKGLLAKVRDLDFDTWSRLRADQSAVLELLGTLKGEEDARSLKAILKFKVDAPGLVKEDDYVVAAEPEVKAKEGEAVAASDPKAKAPRTPAECETKRAKGRFLAAQTAQQLTDAAKEAQKKQNATGFLTQLQATFKTIDDFRTDPEFRNELDLTKLPAAEVAALNQITASLSGLRAGVDAEASVVFGDLWETTDTYRVVVSKTLDGTQDPAPHVIKYHTRGELDVASIDADEAKDAESKGVIGKAWATVGASADGIAGAITAASDRTFLDDFTAIASHGPAIAKEWGPMFAEKLRLDADVAKASSGGDAVAANEALTKHASTMNETRARLVKIEVAKHPELARALEVTLMTKKERDTVNMAFDAKTISVLGATNFSTVKGKTAVAATLAQLFGLEHEAAEALWDANTFEAHTKAIKAHGDVVADQNNGYAVGMGKTLDEAENQAAGAQQIVDGSEAGVSAEDLAISNQLTANVDKAHAKIKERADKVKGYVVASIEAAIGMATASLGLPFALGQVVKMATSLAKNALKAWQEGGSVQTFVVYVMKDALAAFGGQVLSELSGVLDAFSPIPLYMDVSKWPCPFIAENKDIVAALNAGIAQVQAELTAGVTDAFAVGSVDSIKIAIEKGVGNYLLQSGRNIGTKLKDAFASPEGRATMVDGLIAKMGAAELELLKKQLLEQAGIREDEAKDPVVKTLDEDKDGKLDQKKEIEALAEASYLERLGSTTIEALPGFFTEIPAVAFIIDTAKSCKDPKGAYEKWEDLKKSLSKEAIGRAFDLVCTGANLTLESIVQKDLGHLTSGVGSGLMATATDLQSKFETFKKDVTSGKYIWELVVTQATATVEAFNKAWEKYLLADSITELAGEAGNEGLLDALCSKDETKQAMASGFVQLHEGASALTTMLRDVVGESLETTFKDYEGKIDELAKKSVGDGDGIYAQFLKNDTVKSLLVMGHYDALLDEQAQRICSADKNPKMLEVAKAAIAKKLAMSGGGMALFTNVGPQASAYLTKATGNLGKSKATDTQDKLLLAAKKAQAADFAKDLQAEVVEVVVTQLAKDAVRLLDKVRAEVRNELAGLLDDKGAK